MNFEEKDIPEPIERAQKPRKCPNCGMVPMADILYGLPVYNAEMQAQMDRGELVLGGCCITQRDPKWQCSKCGLQIYKQVEGSRPEADGSEEIEIHVTD